MRETFDNAPAEEKDKSVLNLWEEEEEHSVLILWEGEEKRGRGEVCFIPMGGGGAALIVAALSLRLDVVRLPLLVFFFCVCEREEEKCFNPMGGG